MIVLDTNVVSEMMRSSPEQSVLNWLESQDPKLLFIASITVSELVYGCARLADGKRKADIQNRVDWVITDVFAGRVLAFDGKAAAVCGALMAKYPQIPAREKYADFQIAATALATDYSLATRNAKDFVFDGLTVINLWA